MHIFHDFIHVYNSWAEADNPLGPKKYICIYIYQQKGLITSTSDFIHIFNDFLYAYSPRAGANNPVGTNFRCQQTGLITLLICFKFQTNLFEVWFYPYFLCFLYMCLAPGQGQATPWGQKFNVNRKSLSLCPCIASLKNISLKSDFYTLFNDFIHVHSA